MISKRGFQIDSFGTNSMIKVPGPTYDRPNAYSFGTTYDQIYKDLVAKDESLYANKKFSFSKLRLDIRGTVF